MEINSWGMTDVGCVRKNNEDTFLIREDLVLYVVADGVGGAAAGEVASEMFVENCVTEFESYSGWNKDLGVLITRCFRNGNQKLREHMEANPETRGMGCTAELLTFHGNQYYLGHVGDSRTYLIRDGGIQQITKDHSYIQEQIDLGLIQPEDAEDHWLKNTIYRAVGGDDEIEVDLISGHARDEDIFLLCSDGLTDMVSEESILEVISDDVYNLQNRVQNLVQAAKSRGGNDNITVLVVQVGLSSIGEKITSFFQEHLGRE